MKMNKMSWKTLATVSVSANVIFLILGIIFVAGPLNDLRKLRNSSQELCEVYDQNKSGFIGEIVKQLDFSSEIESICED